MWVYNQEFHGDSAYIYFSLKEKEGGSGWKMGIFPFFAFINTKCLWKSFKEFLFEGLSALENVSIRRVFDTITENVERVCKEKKKEG